MRIASILRGQCKTIAAMTHVTPPGFPAIEVGAPAKGLLLHDGRLVLWATADEQFSAHAQAVAALQIPIAKVRVFFTIAADGGASLHTNNAADTAAALKVIGDHGLLTIAGPPSSRRRTARRTQICSMMVPRRREGRRRSSSGTAEWCSMD